jgi:hypothetical protein
MTGSEARVSAVRWLDRFGLMIAVAKKRVRPRKPFSHLHKLTLSSIPWLRRTGANFIVPLSRQPTL